MASALSSLSPLRYTQVLDSLNFHLDAKGQTVDTLNLQASLSRIINIDPASDKFKALYQAVFTGIDDVERREIKLFTQAQKQAIAEAIAKTDLPLRDEKAQKINLAYQRLHRFQQTNPEFGLWMTLGCVVDSTINDPSEGMRFPALFNEAKASISYKESESLDGSEEKTTRLALVIAKSPLPIREQEYLAQGDHHKVATPKSQTYPRTPGASTPSWEVIERTPSLGNLQQ